jgi:hypothetical protein
MLRPSAKSHKPVKADPSALLGLALALVSVLLAIYAQDPAWDAMGSMSIGALLVVVAIEVLWLFFEPDIVD